MNFRCRQPGRRPGKHFTSGTHKQQHSTGHNHTSRGRAKREETNKKGKSLQGGQGGWYHAPNNSLWKHPVIQYNISFISMETKLYIIYYNADMLPSSYRATGWNNSCFCIYAATTLHKSFVSFSFQGAVCIWRCWCFQEQNEFKANTIRGGL